MILHRRSLTQLKLTSFEGKGKEKNKKSIFNTWKINASAVSFLLSSLSCLQNLQEKRNICLLPLTILSAKIHFL